MLDWDKCSNDPVPMKSIRLSDAFEQVQHALRANPKVFFDTVDPSIQEYLIKSQKFEEQRDIWENESRRSLDELQRRKEAVVFFRSNLGRGEFIAYVRDPEDGAILQLDCRDWAPIGGRLLLLEPPYSFEEDFLDNAEFSGNPNTFIRGAYRPVFFWQKEFELWLGKVFGQKKSRGRRRGSGSYLNLDMPFLERMHEMIKAGEAKGAHDAACKVAKDVPHRNAQVSSIVTRLHKSYGRVFGPEQN